MLRKLIRNFFLMAIGKNPYPPEPSIYAIMFDQPHLTPCQASWKVNGRRIILRWVWRIALIVLLLVVGILYWKGS